MRYLGYVYKEKSNLKESKFKSDVNSQLNYIKNTIKDSSTNIDLCLCHICEFISYIMINKNYESYKNIKNLK